VTRHQDIVLDRNTTPGDCHSILRTDIVDVLLAATLRTFGHIFSDRTAPTIFVEGHGREPWDETIDISSTVGCFTTLCPLSVPLNTDQEPIHVLRQVKDTRRRIPSNGWAYFASRYLNPIGQAAFYSNEVSEIFFNFAGQYHQLEASDSLFHAFDFEVSGDASEVGTSTPRLALIEISAVIKNGQLHMSFIINERMHHMARLEQWISQVPITLTSMLETLCSHKTTLIPTLSDFPLLCMTHEAMDSFISDICSRVGVDSWTDIEDIFPCSPLQTAMLLARAVNPQQYRSSMISSVSRPSLVANEDVASAWLKVVTRHPSLRTVFVETQSSIGAFGQVVLKTIQPGTDVIQAATEATALQLLKTHEPAEWSHKSPHVSIICKTSFGVLCKLEITHAVMDGTSMDLICRGLVAALEDKLPTRPSPSYRNYVSYLQKLDSQKALLYWTNYLEGVGSCLIPAIPPVEQRLADNQDLSIKISIGNSSAMMINTFTEAHNVTPASIIQAAWAMVLRCYTQSDDICFGYAVIGRDSPVDGIEETIGPFINVLTCRQDMSSSSMCAIELATKVQRDLFDSLPFRHTSMADIQHQLKLPNRSLFDTIVSIQRYTSMPVDSATEVRLGILHTYDPTKVSCHALHHTGTCIVLTYIETVLSCIKCRLFVGPSRYTIEILSTKRSYRAPR
jgi:non-ribosomal peptide synthase protein (TIGR01720 family)